MVFINVKLPRLLDSNLKLVAELRPTKLNIEPNGDTLSTASMTLPNGEPKVSIRDWVELYTRHGSAGIYRVTRQKDDVGNEQRVTLTHGLCALEDAVIPGEGTFSGDPQSVLQAILGYQKSAMWTCGTVASGPDIKVEYRYTNALEALEDALAKLPDYALMFDQSALPWKLGLQKLSDEESAEARLSRNIKSVSVEEDDSEMCTRVYIDDREGYTDGPTIGTWGVIERVLTVPDGATDEEVEAYVAAYLEQHKNPTKTVTLDAYDLSGETGEELDAFRLWKKARVPLPMESDVLRERITALTWPNVFDDPKNVRVTMGARSLTASDTLRELMNRTTSTERTTADTSKRVSSNSTKIQQNITKLEDTYTELTEFKGETANEFNHVLINLDAKAAKIDLEATQAIVAGHAERISRAEIEIDGANATLKLHASRLDTAENTLNSAVIDIDGANARIALAAEKADTNGKILKAAGISIDAETGVLIYSAAAGTIGARLTVNENGIAAQKEKVDEHGRLLRYSGMKINDDGTFIYSHDTTRSLGTMLDVTPEGVSMVAQRANKADKILTSAGMDVTSTGVLIFAENALGGYKSKIDVQAKQIALVVGGTSTNPEIKAAEIVGSINNMGSTVRISANRINLDGYVTASELEAQSARITSLMTGSTKATMIQATHMQCDTITIDGKTGTWKKININGTDYTLYVW